MLSEDQGSRSWLMFSETLDFGALVHVFEGPKVLDPGSCFLRPRIFGSWLMFLEDQGFFGLWLIFSKDQGFFGLWLMFSEDQRFCVLAHVFRDLGFLDLGSCFQKTKGFWILAHVFRGPRIYGSWLMPMCVAFYTSTCKINIFN